LGILAIPFELSPTEFSQNESGPSCSFAHRNRPSPVGVPTMGPSPKFTMTEGERQTMRSDRVFDALHTLRNRYMLCQLASKATRKFHRPNTRIQETMNDVFDKIADAERHDILSEPENFAEAQRRAA
jgi:hypothetical protein